MSWYTITRRRLALVGVPAAALAVGVGGVAVAATGAGHGGGGNDLPTYHSSVTTKAQDDNGNEATQDRALVRLAKITLPQAAQAAGQAVPDGHVISVALSNEGGNVVYTAGVVTAKNAETEVVVDAGNGHVLATQVDNEQSDKADKADKGDGSGDSGTPAPSTGGGGSHPPTGTSGSTHK